MTKFGIGWPWGCPNPATMAQSIANTGCKEVRYPVQWDLIEPQQGTYDWHGLDSDVYLIRSKGLGVLPVVYRTPSWHRPSRSDPPDPNLYAGFLVQVAKRFQFPAYELWNETNLPGLGDWSGSKEQFADLYRTARAALHQTMGDRYSAVVGGLAYPDGVAYLKSIWSRLGPVDAVGWHPYGLTVTHTWELLHQMVDALNSLGSSAPVDVTEVGLPVGPGRPYTEKQRAGYLKACATKVKDWKRIRRWNVYTWFDGGEWAIAEASGAWKGGAAGYSAGIKS